MKSLAFAVWATAVAALSLPARAQQQQPTDQKAPAAQEQKAPEQKAADQPSPDAVARERTEGAAGGTAPLPTEKRQAVGAGAGPHDRFTAPSPERLPSDQPVQPGK